MTETEYQALKTKIEREFPIRCELSKMLGRPINPKNYKQLEAFDSSIADLFLEIAIEMPAFVVDALDLIRPLFNKD